MVFIRREMEDEVGYNLGFLMNKKETAGQVGIEIEVEGNKFPKNDHPEIPKAWEYHQDGSLRGDDNAEYVFKKPLPFSSVKKEVEDLWKMFYNYGSILDVSNRTSVHVHVNVQTFHLNRLTSFIAIYYALEDILAEWCGEHRVGNLFCLRAKDAPALIDYMRQFIQSDGKALHAIHENIHHYAGLNCGAIKKFGSVEFRTLRGVTEPGPIIQWVGIIERLWRLSGDYQDPRRVCDVFSQGGPIYFAEEMLGDYASPVFSGVKLSQEEIRDSLYDGIRLAQDLCYCRDWSKFRPVEIKRDPFGRDAKKVMKTLSGAQQLDGHYQAVFQEAEEHYAHPVTQPPSIPTADWHAFMENATNTPLNPSVFEL